jgi:hypothetical protein
MRSQALYCTLLLALTFLSGCSIFGDDTEVRSVSVQQFEVAAHSDRTAKFVVTGEWRNTCGTFSRVDSERDDTTYSITMYGQQPEGALCGDAITSISGNWTVQVPRAGTYTFRFQRADSAPLDTTLVFDAP